METPRILVYLILTARIVWLDDTEKCTISAPPSKGPSEKMQTMNMKTQNKKEKPATATTKKQYDFIYDKNLY